VYRSYDYGLIGQYWSEYLATGNKIPAFVLGFVALTLLCWYLIRWRDKACSTAFFEMGFTPIGKDEFVKRFDPGNFSRLKNHVQFGLEHSNYYSGTLLERSVLLFNRSYYTHDFEGKSITAKSTFAMLTLKVELPNFKLANAVVAKNLAQRHGQSNPVKLRASLPMDKFILQGHDHNLLRKLFDDNLCQQFAGTDYIEMECMDGKLLINHHAQRIYTARNARDFIDQIRKIVTALESNDNFPVQENVIKAA